MLRNKWLLQLLLLLLHPVLFPNIEASPTAKSVVKAPKMTVEIRHPMSNIIDKMPAGLCNCGHSNRGDMDIFWTEHDHQPVAKLNYIAAEAVGGELSAIHMNKEKALGSGASSFVYHAELSIRLADGRLAHRCVALKLTKVYDGRLWFSGQQQFQETEWKILEAFAGLPDQRTRRHVVDMFAYGEYREMKRGRNDHVHLVTILELGTGGDFHRHLANMRIADTQSRKRMSEELIEERIWEVLLAARDMHQKAMHLDFKPANLIYVPSGDASKPLVLKAIDFGNSELINAPKSGQVGQQANSCKMMPDHNPRTTAAYESPEHRSQCHQPNPAVVGVQLPRLTTKADIWAIGMIVYQIVMLDPWNEIYNAKTFFQTLETISIFHANHASLLNMWEVNVSVEKRQLMGSALYMILLVRLQFTRDALLLLAVLDRNPIARPTAKGILLFRKRRCYLGNVGLKDTFTRGILPSLSFGQLRAFLAKWDRRMLTMLNEISDRDLNEQFDELNNLKIKDGVPLDACDTHTNGVSSAEISIERNPSMVSSSSAAAAEENDENVRPIPVPVVRTS